MKKTISSSPMNKHKKNGRPKFVIDYEAVAKLGALHCTQDEIATFLGCSVDTLQRDAEFQEIYQSGRDRGKMSLRRVQWNLAEQGNATMQIWLGKQWLGQKDHRHHEVDVKRSAAVEQMKNAAAAAVRRNPSILDDLFCMELERT